MFQFITQEEEEEKMNRRKKSISNHNYLLKFFDENPKPNSQEKREIAEFLDQKYEKINIWFQNERAKRRKYMHVIPFLKFTVFFDEKNPGIQEIFLGNLQNNLHQESSSFVKKDFHNPTEHFDMKNIFSPTDEYEFPTGWDNSTHEHFEQSQNVQKNQEQYNLNRSCQESYDHNQSRQCSRENYKLSQKHPAISFEQWYTASKKKKASHKIVQIFPVCNSLFIPMNKIRGNGYSSKFNNGDTIVIDGISYRYKDITFT